MVSRSRSGAHREQRLVLQPAVAGDVLAGLGEGRDRFRPDLGAAAVAEQRRRHVEVLEIARQPPDALVAAEARPVDAGDVLGAGRQRRGAREIARRLAVAPGLQQHAAHHGHAMTVGPYQRPLVHATLSTPAPIEIPARAAAASPCGGVTKDAGLATIDREFGRTAKNDHRFPAALHAGRDAQGRSQVADRPGRRARQPELPAQSAAWRSQQPRPDDGPRRHRHGRAVLRRRLRPARPENLPGDQRPHGAGREGSSRPLHRARPCAGDEARRGARPSSSAARSISAFPAW